MLRALLLLHLLVHHEQQSLVLSPGGMEPRTCLMHDLHSPQSEMSAGLRRLIHHTTDPPHMPAKQNAAWAFAGYGLVQPIEDAPYTPKMHHLHIDKHLHRS